ncbi:small subunit ribosomal protein S1 [Bacilli bacterium PM5-3]|nr:small subunit ribosomal protein S1 [Bacilli bacterium PM5-3]MDH6604225.1 small subunit ribosomal protein S1 [Bacilli bacterium PM5-9]
MKNVVGSIYTGEIVHKDQNSYLVDLGIGFDAILNKEEAEGELEVGDQVDVIVAYYVKDDYFVSMKGVSRKKRTEELDALIGTDQTTRGKVTSYKNKRFIVDLGNGAKGSVYVKNMDTKFIEDGSGYIGNEYDFLIVEKSRRGFEDYDLNRRDLLVKEHALAKEEFNSKYHVGDKVVGKVVEAIEAGIILDVDGTNCFIPRSEIAHYALKEMPEVGTEFEAIVKEVQERSLSLKGSIKELQSHPFEQAKDLKIGDIIKGKISRIVEYGIFTEIFDHLDGLVHISEVSYEHTKDLSNFEAGQDIEVKVINVDNDKRKIGLSIKRLQPSPYEYLKEKVNVGDTISVLIKRITENGIRVMVMDNFYTTIINEDIHDFSKIKPTLRINDRLEVIVMELDDENEKVVLSNEEFVKKEYELLEQSI